MNLFGVFLIVAITLVVGFVLGWDEADAIWDNPPVWVRIRHGLSSMLGPLWALGVIGVIGFMLFVLPGK